MEDAPNFQRIAQAIMYLNTHFKQQPSLEEVAEQVHWSPQHFQRIFSEWAGVSPKKFLQYISAEYAKRLLRNQASVFEAAHEVGLSGTGRLHDLFVNVEGMTPGEYKNGGEGLHIKYSFSPTLFGTALSAATHKGLCYLAFADTPDSALRELKALFPNAHYTEGCDAFQERAICAFGQETSVQLHLKGTPFQLKVWEALLKIPAGQVCAYSGIAQYLGLPRAARAVGSAVADNPIAYLIPCHRVIQASGVFGQYHWGSHRKTAMLGFEFAKSHFEE